MENARKEGEHRLPKLSMSSRNPVLHQALISTGKRAERGVVLTDFGHRLACHLRCIGKSTIQLWEKERSCLQCVVSVMTISDLLQGSSQGTESYLNTCLHLLFAHLQISCCHASCGCGEINTRLLSRKLCMLFRLDLGYCSLYLTCRGCLMFRRRVKLAEARERGQR